MYQNVLSTDQFYHTPVLPNTTSRDRFTQIMRYLHFANSELEPLPGAQSYDPLYEVKPLKDHFNIFNTCFNHEYNPKRNVTIDERMISFKVDFNFDSTCMPSKPHKWEVKERRKIPKGQVWLLAESQNRFIEYKDIYPHDPGRRAIPQLHLASNVVKRCLQGAQLEGTAACGTVRINRSGLPVDILVMCKRLEGINQLGDMEFRQKGCLVAAAWKDKEIVNVLSKVHDNSSAQVLRPVNTGGN
ncbi:unnamed protein product [Mytilus coruscus]|uniref:PiggyBac transposable element-derived protein domain-containing protein n=1 Tax=Mytilus coruscus TaxID=42192 RepID=A0A6J8ASD6_MYTCO|nr:unnamed protein product [Mytilus coruscus]